MPPHTPARSKRAASGVMALIFMSIIAVISIAIIMTLLETNLTVQAGQQELTLKVQDQIALAQSITATWAYDPAAQEIEINVTNQYTQPITINRIGIIMPDKSIILYPPANNTPLGLTIPPGQTQTLTIPSIPTKPNAITLHASTPTQASTTITAQEPPTSGGNVTNWLQTSLPTVAPTNTTTWAGTLTLTTSENKLFTPQTITTTIGTGTGTATAVNVTDGTTYKLTTSTTPTLTITLLNRTAIAWIPQNYHFTENPLAKQQVIPQNGTWNWDGTTNVQETNSTTDTKIYSFFVNILVRTWVDWSVLNITGIPTEFYVITSVRPQFNNSINYAGSFDIVLTDGANYATFGIISYNTTILSRSSMVYFTSLTGGPTSSRSATISLSNYNPLMLHYNTATGAFNLTLLSSSSTTSSLTGTVGVLAGVTAIGLGNGELEVLDNIYTYGWRFYYHYYIENPSSYFDYVYITNATDPTKVYIVNTTNVDNVVIQHPSAPVGSGGNFTGNYDPLLGAWVVSIFPQNSVFEPVLEGATIIVEVGTTSVNLTTTVMGGDYYLVAPRYVGQAVMETQYTGPGSLTSSLSAVFSVNGTLDALPVNDGVITVEAYDFLNGVWDTLWTGTYTLNTPTPVVIADGSVPLVLSEHVNATNYARLRITILGDRPHVAYIDMLNVNATVAITSTKQIFALGHNDTVRLYEITSTAPPSVTPVTTLASPLSAIGWEADFTAWKDTVYVFDGVSLWWQNLTTSLGLAPTPVTASGTPAGMVGLEAFEVGGAGRLLLLFANTTGSYYMVVDAASPTTSIVPETRLPAGLELGGPAGTRYIATAAYGSGVYTVLFNNNDGNYWLAYYDGATDTWSLKTIVSGGRVVGLAADASSVYLMLEGGGFQAIDHTTLTATPLPQPPFYPMGPSDRMEVFPGPIIWFTRADDTNELWYYIP